MRLASSFACWCLVLVACGPDAVGSDETSESWAGTTGQGCCDELPADLMVCVNEAAPDVEVGTTFEWVFYPDQINEDVCTVTDVQAGAETIISLDCSAEPAVLTVPATPIWDPPLTPGTSVRLRAVLESDMTPGVGPYLSWRIDRFDDQSLVAAFASGRVFAPLDDPLAAEIVDGMCVPDCEAGIEPVMLHVSEGDEELSLTAPSVGSIGTYQVWLGKAEQNLCAPGDGLFNVMIALQQ